MNLKAILIVAALAVGGAAFGQGAAKAGQGPGAGRPEGRGPGGGQMRMRTPEERVERLAKNLSLNADQKKKVLAIYKASASKGKSIFEDKKLTDQQKRAAFEKIRDDNTKKIKALLTKDQIKKYDEMRQRRGPGGPGAPGAPGRGPGSPPKGGKAGGKGG